MKSRITIVLLLAVNLFAIPVFAEKDFNLGIGGKINERFWGVSSINQYLDSSIGVESFFSTKNKDLTLGVSMGGATTSYQDTVWDENVLMYWSPYFFLADSEVQKNMWENITLWSIDLNYWHPITKRKKIVVQIGPGLHILAIEQHVKTEVQYAAQKWYPEIVLLTPHFHNETKDDFNVFSGVSLGLRGKLNISSSKETEKVLGSINVGCEFLLMPGVENRGLKLMGKPIDSLNHFNCAAGFTWLLF